MKMLFENHSFTTARCMELVDVTGDLTDLVARSGVKNGMAVVFSPHTTCAVLINEREAGFSQDFEDLVQSLVPETRTYRHDDMTLRTENLDDDAHDVPNGHAHCKQSLIGSASQAIPVVDGKLQLGRWQRVFFVELDRARDRRVLMQVMGE